MCCSRDGVRGYRYFKNIIETDLLQRSQDIVSVGKIRELTVQCRRRQRNGVLKVLEHLEGVNNSSLCMLGADADTLAAIDASFAYYDRFFIAYAYRFRWAAFYAGCATFAFIVIQTYGVYILVHSRATPPGTQESVVQTGQDFSVLVMLRVMH